ncbi:MAG: hypothetical protein J5884_00795 [Paludibacteraceae bacterium]|nr:hypothetical protein [Paludibacteraceae bacterium]
MKNFNIKFVLVALCAIVFASCDEIVQHFVDPSEYEMLTSIFDSGKPSTAMEVTDVTFSPDYKNFSVSTRLLHEGPGFQFTDTTLVRTEVVEVIDGIHHTKLSTPRLVGMRNVESECVAENGLTMLILVDKTLPQAELSKIQKYVREMRTIFDHNNLYVAFMDGDEVTKNLPVTNYVLDAYFKQSEKNYIYLYRAIQTKREEIKQRRDIWQNAARRVMITFADEKTYDDDSDIPYDPEHYRFEELLVRNSRRDTTFYAYYVNMNPETGAGDNEQSVPLVFCRNNGGEYITDYNWITLKRKIYSGFHFDFPDNEFTFVNPDYKVYRGDRKELTLNIYNKKTNQLVVSFTTTVKLGQLYKPIIVCGHSIYYVFAQGILLTLFMLLLVFFVMQIIVPVVSYIIFRHKYVISYAGPNMSMGTKAVAQTCYLCKAPFVPGEKIVVKCEHTMHESCWEENGYHCPEYSDRCKHGSHYFNKEQLFDRRNAPFYMKWVLMAILTAALSWLGFSIYMHFHFDAGLLAPIVRPPVSQVPFMGGVSGFFITLGLAVYAVSGYGWRKAGQVFLRSFIAAVACYAAILIVDAMILAFDIERGITLINGLPWVASCFIIALCATFGTRVVYNRRLVLATLLLGLVSMIVWALFYQRAELDYRVLLLLSFVIVSVGMAVSIATVAPRSERYFLKVEGAVKTMDVALYKWFRHNADRTVTIGKSVDCSLQLSWDVQSAVAPIQAEIRLIREVPYLIAREKGVLIKGRSVAIGKRIRLYHGASFSIGQTLFTYIEKDR